MGVEGGGGRQICRYGGGVGGATEISGRGAECGYSGEGRGGGGGQDSALDPGRGGGLISVRVEEDAGCPS